MKIIKLAAIAIALSSSSAIAQSSVDDSILSDEFVTTQDFIEATVVRVHTSKNTLVVRGEKRGQTREFTVPADTRITVNGKQARLRDIRRGDDVLLVMTPKDYEVVITSVRVPEPATPLEQRQAEPEVAEAMPAMLPNTASSWPLVLVTGLLALLGAAVLRIRSRA